MKSLFPQRQVRFSAILPILHCLVFTVAPVSAQTHVSGTYNLNVTWTAANNPYVIDTDLTVASGATLTIEPGVIVKFGRSGSLDRLRVSAGGTLRVNGLHGQRVVFTSIEDDSVGGDTGSDGPTTGAPGQWLNIYVLGKAFVAYTDIRYGGYGSSANDGAVSVGTGGLLLLEYVTVSHSQVTGLAVTSGKKGNVFVIASEFSSNQIGIYVSNSPVSIGPATTITSNGRGIFVNYANYADGMPIVVMNSDVTNNSDYGVWIQLSGTLPERYPYGQKNNIFNNGAGADKRQLYPANRISDADWSNNYWGSVQQAVSCSWAPAGYHPFHLSYSSANPYTEPVKAGPIGYTPHTKIENGQFLTCGSDWVTSTPHAASAFNNSALLSNGALQLCNDERDVMVNEYRPKGAGGVYDEGVVPLPHCTQFEYHASSYQYLPNFTWGELNGGFAQGNPHTGFGLITARLANGLTATRTNYGSAIHVSSAYRCPHGNNSYGSTFASHHMRGKAADMYKPGGNVAPYWTQQEFDALKAAADATTPTPIESFPYTQYPDRHYHVAW